MTYCHWDCDGIQKLQKITRPLFEALSLYFKADRENRANPPPLIWGLSPFICQTFIAGLSYKENIWLWTSRGKRSRDSISWEEWKQRGMQKEDNAMLSLLFSLGLCWVSLFDSCITHLRKHQLGAKSMDLQ